MYACNCLNQEFRMKTSQFCKLFTTNKWAKRQDADEIGQISPFDNAYHTNRQQCCMLSVKIPINKFLSDEFSVSGNVSALSNCCVIIPLGSIRFLTHTDRCYRTERSDGQISKNLFDVNYIEVFISLDQIMDVGMSVSM